MFKRLLPGLGAIVFAGVMTSTTAQIHAETTLFVVFVDDQHARSAIIGLATTNRAQPGAGVADSARRWG